MNGSPVQGFHLARAARAVWLPRPSRNGAQAAIVALALFLPSPIFADDTTFDPPKKKAKPRAAVVKPPEPSPKCFWTPGTIEPCNCFWKTGTGDWEWNACQDKPPSVERLAFEELPVVEPEPAPPLPVPAPSLPEPGFRLGLQTWALAGFSGAADETYTAGARLLAEGPVAVNGKGAVRMFATLDLAALPGESVSFASVESFGRSAEFTGGLTVRLAERWPEGQHITTSAVVWGGFSTIRDVEILDRYLRRGGIGIRLAEETSHAEITVSWCRDEVVGWIGPAGGACISGSAPLPGTKGAMVMGGNAVLSFGRATTTPQRDVLRVWVGASIGDIVDAVRGLK